MSVKIVCEGETCDWWTDSKPLDAPVYCPECGEHTVSAKDFENPEDIRSDKAGVIDTLEELGYFEEDEDEAEE